MARLTLAILPDGRAVLTTEERLDDKSAFELRGAIEGWKDGRWPVLVIPDCRTVQITELDLDLRHVEPSAAEIRHEQLLEGVR